MRNPYSPPAAPVDDIFNSENKSGGGSEIIGPEGLRGWLALVGLGIVISPFYIIARIFSTYSGVFSNGIWANLTTPGTKAYNPLWAPLLLGEIAIQCGLALVSIYLVFLFFSKKKIFQIWYIGTLLFSMSFVILEALVVNFLFPNIPVFNAETIKTFGSSIIVTLIWVPYMLVSKRVKATFVK
jgi:hypothetical protein